MRVKLIVALNNEKIKEQLSKIYSDKMYEHDITYMEGTIEYISKNTNKGPDDYVLITKDTLEGNLTKYTYIKQLRLANENIRIILFVKELDNKYKDFLFANDVFDIVEIESISPEELKDLIERNESVIYKYIDKSNIMIDSSSEIINKMQQSKKNIISIFGTSGSGKSYLANQIVKKIATNIKEKVCLLDMDLEDAATDIINDIDSNNYCLSRIVDDIDKNDSIQNVLEYMYQDNKKIGYITNNVSIYEYQNKLSSKYYEKIYEAVKKSYNYIFVDLPASPFLDVVEYTLRMSHKVLFIVNPNYISVRQAVKHLDLITRVWKIEKERIYIIVNKVQKNSLDISQIKNILKEYKVITSVNYNSLVEGYINGFYSNIDEQIDINSICSELEIKRNNGAKLIKESLLTSFILKNRREVVNDNKSF
jgi:MinD-like ATPase involved in chromosome partitioning or flagellar assembly